MDQQGQARRPAYMPGGMPGNQFQGGPEGQGAGYRKSVRDIAQAMQPQPLGRVEQRYANWGAQPTSGAGASGYMVGPDNAQQFVTSGQYKAAYGRPQVTNWTDPQSAAKFAQWGQGLPS